MFQLSASLYPQYRSVGSKRLHKYFICTVITNLQVAQYLVYGIITDILTYGIKNDVVPNDKVGSWP